MFTDVVLDNVDLVSVVLAFSRRDEYLFFGTANRVFLHTMGGHRQTHVARCFETVSRLEDSGMESYSSTSVQERLMMYGSVEVLRHALSAGLVDSANGALEHVIRSKNKALVDALKKEFHETRFGPSCQVAAVESGSLEMVQAYCADGVLDPRAPNFGLEDNYFYPFDMRAKRMICRRWKMYVGDYLIGAAKQCGHFEILKWLHANNIPSADEISENHDIIGEAAIHGNREMVEWMLAATGYHPSACEIPYASHSNGVAYLEWLAEKGCLIDPESLDVCSNADAEVTAWLRDKGFSV